MIPAGITAYLSNSLSLGIIFGLLIGKPLGILLFCWIMIKLKLGQLAKGIQWKHMIGLGFLASIGFTMSIFISMLAFKDSFTQDISKMAVMLASLIGMILSYVWFKIFTKETQQHSLASFSEQEDESD